MTANRYDGFIYTTESNGRDRANISKMFGSTGPYVIAGQRLDALESIKVLLDESTRTIHESGSGTTKTKASSVIGRTIVGGVLLGGVGAIAGAATAKKDVNTTTKRFETVNTKLTVELKFTNGKSISVIVKSLTDYHWLVNQSSVTTASDEDLEKLKLEGQMIDRNEALEKVRWESVDKNMTDAPPQDTGDLQLAVMVSGMVFGIAFGAWAGFASGSFWLFLLVAIVLSGIGIAAACAMDSTYITARKEYQNKRVQIYNKLYPK